MTQFFKRRSNDYRNGSCSGGIRGGAYPHDYPDYIMAPHKPVPVTELQQQAPLACPPKDTLSEGYPRFGTTPNKFRGDSFDVRVNDRFFDQYASYQYSGSDCFSGSNNYLNTGQYLINNNGGSQILNVIHGSQILNNQAGSGGNRYFDGTNGSHLLNHTQPNVNLLNSHLNNTQPSVNGDGGSRQQYVHSPMNNGYKCFNGSQILNSPLRSNCNVSQVFDEPQVYEEPHIVADVLNPDHPMGQVSSGQHCLLWL